MSVSRRHFLAGCSAAIAGMAGGRIHDLVFAQDGVAAAASNEILITVFLRGGCDGLNLVAPFDDPAYATARGSLAVPSSAALPLDPRNASFGSSVGLHPSAAPLNELYAASKLAIVHAAGLDDATRSHFDAMDYMERGTPGNKNTPSGWLARHLQTSGSGGLLPAVASASALPASLLNYADGIAMRDRNEFKLQHYGRYMTSRTQPNLDPAYKPFYETLRTFYGGSTAFQTVGQRTFEAIDTLSAEEMDYTPAPGITYPGNSFGNALKLIAQIVKFEIGLHIATVDFGGWDTHEYQGNGNDTNSYFGRQVDTFARGIHALYNDLSAYWSRLTIVVMSEFGRRLGANTSGGTDHGHGNVMFVLGGNVNGGKIYGAWPGLVDLDQNQDLKVTTDYRQVLSEILIKRLQNPRLGIVFPGYTGYQPLGLLSGANLPVDYSQGHRLMLPIVTR